MPHIHIKHFPVELDERRKMILVEALTTAATEAFGCDSGAVSIALEPVEPAIWQESVYAPCILARQDLLCKIPNY